MTQNYVDRYPKEFPPKGYDSVAVAGQGPDPLHTVKVDRGGLEVPLGNVKGGQSGSRYFSWGPSYPEFICYKVR